MIDYRRSIPIVAEPDVLVCGTGCAGLAAAASAARMGASTMAVEQFGFAGGFMTAVMSTGVDGLCDMTTGEVVVGGVALEVLERLGVLALPLASRKLFDPMLDESSIDRHPAKLPVRIGNIERFKLVADALLLESGVRVLYHTKLIDVVASGSGVGDVIIGNKDGIAAIRPRIVIDCTGDADIAAWAGAPCEISAIHQPGSLHFRVGNVKVTSEADDLYALTRRCAGALEQVHAAGKFGLYAGPWLSPSGPGEVMFNAVRLPFDSTSAEETTRAEMKGRRDAWAMFELWRERLPEFAGSHFVTSGPTVGARESRRIAGGYTLTADDILKSRPFPDAIARGSWYIDRHPLESSGFHRHVTVKAYDIPYRTLLPHGVDNLLVAGRCHSATPEALASSRVNMTAMAMGQAAGVAAALAVQGDRSPADVDVVKLRRDLLKQGAILDG